MSAEQRDTVSKTRTGLPGLSAAPFMDFAMAGDTLYTLHPKPIPELRRWALPAAPSACEGREG